jgi:flagellar basal body-associated protein FliL
VFCLSFFVISTFVYAGDEEDEAKTKTKELVLEYLELSSKFTVNLDKPNKSLVVCLLLIYKQWNNAKL